MNANELAGEFNADNIFWNEDNLRHWGKEASTMLRQQQADLKDADKYALELERLYEDAKAEIEMLKKQLTCSCGEPSAPNTVHRKDNPCYVKELTDDEYKTIFANGKRLGVIETENRFWKSMNLEYSDITDAIIECDLEAECFAGIETKIRNFARAILRKAQEQ